MISINFYPRNNVYAKKNEVAAAKRLDACDATKRSFQSK